MITTDLNAFVCVCVCVRRRGGDGLSAPVRGQCREDSEHAMQGPRCRTQDRPDAQHPRCVLGNNGHREDEGRFRTLMRPDEKRDFRYLEAAIQLAVRLKCACLRKPHVNVNHSKRLTNCLTFTHSHTEGGVNHARQQPARQEQLGGGFCIRDTSTLS